MAITVHYGKTARLTAIKKKTVAIIGYGSQGHAHAQNLRDSGADVIIGLYSKTSPSAKSAKKDKFKVLPIAEATAAADVVMLLVPDEFAADVYAKEVTKSERRQPAAVRPRLQHPLRFHQPTRKHRRCDAGT